MRISARIFLVFFAKIFDWLVNPPTAFSFSAVREKRVSFLAFHLSC
jgi:hypothetical protein